MEQIVHLRSISDINRFVQGKTSHPLVAVIDFTKADQHIEDGMKITADFYSVMFKDYCANKLRYGRQPFDFDDGSLLCLAPRQVLTMDTAVEKKENKMGWGLFFHPDLLRGTSLTDKMGEYTFFSYDASESLHLSEKERQVLYDCVQKIEVELLENIDVHSQTLIVSNIELLLNYCARYYGRQFITRKGGNVGILTQVERLLAEYFKRSDLSAAGLPTVGYLADNVHLSPGYLSDLLKRETGLGAQDHIHYHLIERAKNILLGTNCSVSEVAYSLGFEYPQYFSKLFKLKTGQTPIEYRNHN